MLVIVLGLVLGVCGEYKSRDYPTEYDPIEEIQHAACQIATKEIEATANATITRQLKGICTSKELTTKLDKIERRLMKEFDNIKSMLDPNGTTINKTRTLNQVSELGAKDRSKKEAKKRELEIVRYNGTTSFNGREKEFYYYWRIDDAEKELRSESLMSCNFFCSGRIYYINLYPKHLNTRYTAVQLKTTGFVKRPHRFVILDQGDSKYDVSSQVLNDPANYAALYRISGEKVKKFVQDNTLVIKLILYV